MKEWPDLVAIMTEWPDLVAIMMEWPDLVPPAWHVWCNEMMSM